MGGDVALSENAAGEAQTICVRGTHTEQEKLEKRAGSFRIDVGKGERMIDYRSYLCEGGTRKKRSFKVKRRGGKGIKEANHGAAENCHR